MQANSYIDIHTHNRLNNPDVSSVVNYNISEFEQNAGFPGNCSVGIHPWDILKTDVGHALQQLAEYSRKPNVIAIGEIGLDRLASSDLAKQEEVFISQLKIAENTNKPVIVHCVRCFQELLDIRKKTKTQIPWIIHGFHKNEETAKKLLDSGCYLSFGEALFNDPDLQEIFKNTPDNQFFLETDDSDLSIKFLYQKASELKNIGIDFLKTRIKTNYKVCFNKYEQ